MKHGPRCPGCRMSMHVEHENEGDFFVCDNCGHAEPVRTVADDLTARAPAETTVRHSTAKALFDKMREAAQ